MTEFTFTKATKEQAKLRLAIFGPSGSGKTFTALRLATGLGGNIAFIDTERGSASMYADRFEFDLLELTDKDINTYCAAIHAAQKASYAVLIIDSLTHAWQELLQEVDKLARAKYRGNTWAAWSEGTPKQRTLVNTILNYDGHIIATMRTKTEWTVEVDGKKTRPVRIGLAPMQGKGIEYEFDLLLELSPEHIANCIKDRTGKYQDKIIEMPGEELGQELAAWLMEGAKPSPSKIASSPKQKVEKSTPTTEHWIDKTSEKGSVRVRFAAFLENQGLTYEDALQKLNVENIYDFTGSMGDAMEILTKKNPTAAQNTPTAYSWPGDTIQSLMAKGLADHPKHLINRLNLSTYITPEDGVDRVEQWLAVYQTWKNGDAPSEKCAAEADVAMRSQDEGAEEKAPSPGTPVDETKDIPF